MTHLNAYQNLAIPKDGLSPIDVIQGVRWGGEQPFSLQKNKIKLVSDFLVWECDVEASHCLVLEPVESCDTADFVGFHVHIMPCHAATIEGLECLETGYEEGSCYNVWVKTSNLILEVENITRLCDVLDSFFKTISKI